MFYKNNSMGAANGRPHATVKKPSHCERRRRVAIRPSKRPSSSEKAAVHHKRGYLSSSI